MDSDVNFSLVTRLEIVRLLLAFVEKQGWEIHHLDMKKSLFKWEYSRRSLYGVTRRFCQEKRGTLGLSITETSLQTIPKMKNEDRWIKQSTEAWWVDWVILYIRIRI